jgi:hypothetical protein
MRNGFFSFAFLLGVMGGTTHGALLLGDGNSTLDIDLTPGAQLGAINWVIDGVNLLPAVSGGITDYRQWFWYRVGATPEASLDTLPLSVAGTSDVNFNGSPETAFVRYIGAPGFKIEVTFKLTGGTPGSGISDIDEQISIVNTGGSPLSISFFQYGDFQLSSPLVGGENVSFTNSNAVRETGSFGHVQETVITPSATHREALDFPLTITKLNDAFPDNLIDNTNAGPGDITWTYQWDFVIAPGGTALISKDMQAAIPEPSTVALILVGFVGLGLIRRRN